MLIREKVKTAVAVALLTLLAGAGAWAAEAETPAGRPPAVFDNSRTLNGSVKKASEAACVLGSKGVLVIRSAERFKRLLDQLAHFGWNQPAGDKNPLANVDFSRQTVCGVFNCECHGHIINELKCLGVHGDANAVEIQFVLSCTANCKGFTAPSFHFAFVAIPDAKKTKVSIATYDPAAGGTAGTAQLEWSGAFDVQRGDWVDGLSASIEPEKAVISTGGDIKLKFTLAFNNAGAVKPGWFGEALSSAFVWDGVNSNGYDHHSFLVERPDGKTVLVRVRPVEGWDENAPHPVEIMPDKPYVLPNWGGAGGAQLKSLQGMLTEDGKKSEDGFKTGVPGRYKITGIYREYSLGENDDKFMSKKQPKMWGGDIASNTVEVEVQGN